MYRPDAIKTNLSGLLGWRQNVDVSSFTISDSLTLSSSGQYYQDFHPLLTLDNLKSISPDFSRITYPDWVVTTNYRVGDRVTFNALGYRAKLANIGLNPEANPNQWERFDPFSEWLETKTQASILKAVRNFWEKKLAKETAKNVLESKTIYTGTGRLSDLIAKTGSLVGFEITPIRSQGISTKIERIGLQFTGQGPMKLYLMHSSRKDVLRVFEFNRVRSTGVQWFNVSDLFLAFDDHEEVTPGGSWYLVYKEDDLAADVQAVNNGLDYSQRPCSTCNREAYENFALWSKYLEIHPFKAPAQPETTGDFSNDFNNDFFVSDLQLWDVEKNAYTYSTNWGLNLQVSVNCDITEILIRHKETFQNVIGLQVAADFLREFAYNPNFRLTRDSQNLHKTEILYELDGDSQSNKKSGIAFELETAINGLNISLENMSRACFTCNKKGLKYRTV